MQHYDIVIWSATDMRWIERKMAVLNVSNNVAYKIMFYLDNAAMITVHTPKYGVVSVSYFKFILLHVWLIHFYLCLR